MLILELFLAGDIVMYPFLGFSIVAIALIVERLGFWVRIHRWQERVVRDVLRIYQQFLETAAIATLHSLFTTFAVIWLNVYE
ncbi:MAG: hypothetical protein F6K28_20725 [Microcoleus sp. SIO2G3]|nr:hypothetical protein [Microcoleus sp. SIO2G3]